MFFLRALSCQPKIQYTHSIIYERRLFLRTPTKGPKTRKQSEKYRQNWLDMGSDWVYVSPFATRRDLALPEEEQ